MAGEEGSKPVDSRGEPTAPAPGTDARPSIQISMEPTDEVPLHDVPEDNDTSGIMACEPSASDHTLLSPPVGTDMHRATSVELIPPPEIADIDNEDFDEKKHVEYKQHMVPLKDAWRSRKNLANFLTRNHYFHIFVLIMVLADVIVVLVELILDLELIKSNECRVNSDCPPLSRTDANDTSSFQTCLYNTSLDHCLYQSGKHRCLIAGAHHDIDPAEVFHYLGLAILAYFNLEVIVKIFALGKHLFKHKLEMFDMFVVVTSLILDLTIGGAGARDSISLLILLRLWRVTRIFNGITIAVEEREREKRHKLKHEKELADKDVIRLQKIVHELKLELKEWHSRANVAPTYTGLHHAHEVETTDGKPKKDHHFHLPHIHIPHPHLPNLPHPHFGKKDQRKAGQGGGHGDAASQPATAACTDDQAADPAVAACTDDQAADTAVAACTDDQAADTAVAPAVSREDRVDGHTALSSYEEAAVYV